MCVKMVLFLSCSVHSLLRFFSYRFFSHQEYFRILKINLILIPIYVNSCNFHNTHHFPSALCLQPIALIYHVIGGRRKAEACHVYPMNFFLFHRGEMRRLPCLPRKEVYPVKLLALCNPRSGATQLHRAGNI